MPHHDPASDATPIERADAAAVEAAAPARETAIVRLTGALSELADQPPLFTFAGVILAGGLLSGEPRLTRAGGGMLAAVALATWLKTRIKRRVDRTRPFVLVDQDRYRMKGGDDHSHAASSFPSGHTAGAVAAARAYARAFPDQAVGAGTAAVAVALIQIPRCKHYPSDVAVGAAIGLLADAAAHRLGRALAVRLPRLGLALIARLP